MRIIYFVLLSVLLVGSPAVYAENMCQSTSSTATSGTLYDSGGPNGNYGRNEYCGFLIQPAGASSITLTFSSFDLGNNDYVRVYDGTTTAGMLLASLTGSQGGSYTANSGAMYVVIDTTGRSRNDGFAATWSAVTGPITLPLPRADWHLDEMSWSGAVNEIKDYSVNAYHSKASMVLNTTTDSVVCRAADLRGNGTSDFLSLDYRAMNGLTDFTFSIWGKTSETQVQSILSGFGPTYGNEVLFYFDSSTYFHPIIRTNTFYGNRDGFNVTSFANNQWHHFAFTRSGDTVCLYLDGVLQGCKNGLSTQALSILQNGLIIGQEQDSLAGSFDINQDWDGLVDEPMVFSSVLNSSQISAIYNNQRAGKNYDGTTRRCSLPAPVFNYRFDTCNWANGQDVVDSGPLRLDAYSVNGVLSTVGGQICGLAQFDSVNDYVRLPDRAEVDLSTALTITTWVRLKNTPSELKTILSKDTNYEFHINNARRVFWWWNDENGNTRSFSSASAISLNQWHHIAITYVSGLQVIYIDGVESARQTFTGNLRLNNNDLQIGQDQGLGNRFFDGDIDEVKLFNINLDASEIAQIYQNEAAGLNYDGALRPCNCTEPVAVDHYAITHAGSLVSCLAGDVTITAHDQADAAVDAGDSVITITTSTAKGEWLSIRSGSGVLTNLGNGQATYQFPNNGESSVTLAFSYPDLTTDPESVNFNVTDSVSTDRRNSASPEDQNLSVSDSGLVFTIPDTESCLSSTSVVVRAVKKSTNTNSCASAVSGNRTVYFNYNYLSPSTGSRAPKLTANGVEYTLNTSSPGVPVSMQFDAQGEAAMTVAYSDAGQLTLNASLTTANKTLMGSNSYVSYPAQLVPSATIPVTGASLTNQTVPGGAVLSAGANFDLAISAQCASGVVTPNYQPTSAQWGGALFSPTLATGGSSGQLTRSTGTLSLVDTSVWQTISSGFSAGVLSDSARYSEVGVIRLLARDANYKGHAIAEQSTIVGRFIPWRFDLTANTPEWGAHCSAGSFAYSGEEVGFTLAPQISVAAYGLGGGRVNNYGGSYWQLPAVKVGRQYVNQSGSVATLESTLDLLSGNWSGTETDYDGVGIHTLAGDRVKYTHAALESPFAMLTDLVFSVTDWTDNDGACYRVDTDADGDWSDEGCASFTLADIAGAEIRFGRLALADTFGPETEPLNVLWKVEFYNGSDFVTNSLDSCSAWLNSEVSYSDVDGNLMASGLIVPSYTYPDSDFRVESGDAGVRISAPGAGNTGSVMVNVDLSRLPYFQFDWDGDGLFDNSPSAKIFFGKYRSHDKVIFQRQW